MPRIKAAIFALFTILPAGCGQNVPDGTPCSNSSDCNNSQICFWGECRHSGNGSSLVYWQITPPATGKTAPLQQGRPVDLAKTRNIQIELPPVLPRTLFYKNLNSGFVQITHPAAIPGQPVTETAPLIADGASDSLFNINLPAGEYSLVFWPADRARPPHYISWPVTDGSSYLLSYPLEQEEYYGHIQWESTTVSPLDGAEITARDTDGHYCGHARSNKDGNYTISCPSGTAPARLLISSGEKNPLVPDLDIRLNNNSRNLPTVTIGEDLPLSYLFNGFIYDETGYPISGATVKMQEILGDGTFYDSVFSQQNGSATLSVWGEQNGAILVSCPGYDWDIQYLTFPQDGSNSSFSFTLNKAPTASGYIYNNQGTAAIPQAEIIAETSASVQAGLMAPTAVYQTATDNQGKYRLALPHGDYRLTVKPLATSGLPWGQFYLRVTQDSRFDLRLPASQLAEGYIKQAGKPLSEAIVDFYSLDFTVNGTPQHIGQTTTDNEGHFLVTLPVGL